MAAVTLLRSTWTHGLDVVGKSATKFGPEWVCDEVRNTSSNPSVDCTAARMSRVRGVSAYPRSIETQATVRSPSLMTIALA